MLLEARDVTKAFGSFKAVDAASITLAQGDILGLIGPNGAGKSTLFNCLTGDLLSTSGKVLLEGHDITDLTILVPQSEWIRKNSHVRSDVYETRLAYH